MNDEMEYAQRIKEYSTADLQTIAHDLDREKNPDRYDLVLKELKERKRSGDHARSSHVPSRIGWAIWWAFFWRASVVMLFVAWLLGYANNYLVLLGASNVVRYYIINAAFLLIFLVVGSRLFAYVLAKRYSGFRIDIVNKESIQPTDGPYSQESAPCASPEKRSS